MGLTRWALIAAVATAIMGFVPKTQGADAPAKLKPPPHDEFLVIPARVYLLKSSELPDLEAHLKDVDVRRIFRKINGIWNQAGVHWHLEEIRPEPAPRQAEFKAAIAAKPDATASYRILASHTGRNSEGLNVYYIHHFHQKTGLNGVYLNNAVLFVQETARLRPVEGGIDEPLPRVTGHELGHSLGLPHRQDTFNLMASGTSGTTLSPAEVETTRAAARKIKGSRTVPEIRKAAVDLEKAGDAAGAAKLRAILAEIPGHVPPPARP